jgi:hypothetical protein
MGHNAKLGNYRIRSVFCILLISEQFLAAIKFHPSPNSCHFLGIGLPWSFRDNKVSHFTRNSRRLK